MDEFENAVIKPDEALTPEDIKVILANKDKFNDEEKVRFEKLTETGFPEEVPEQTPEEKVATEKVEADRIDEEEKNKKTEPTEEEKLEIKKLETQKEIDKFVADKKKELEEAGATKKEISEEKEKILEIWKYSKNDKDEIFIAKENSPRDWNEAMTQTVKYLKDHPDILFKDIAPQMREYLRELDTKDQEKISENNKVFDTEVDTMAKEGKIADPKTPEGKLVDYLITLTGAKNGLNTMKDAYDLWTKVAPEFGGGYGYKVGTPLWEIKDGKIQVLKVDDKKIDIKTQKQAASKVGAGGTGGGKSIPEKKYSDIHRKSMDEILG